MADPMNPLAPVTRTGPACESAGWTICDRPDRLGGYGLIPPKQRCCINSSVARATRIRLGSDWRDAFARTSCRGIHGTRREPQCLNFLPRSVLRLPELGMCARVLPMGSYFPGR